MADQVAAFKGPHRFFSALRKKVISLQCRSNESMPVITLITFLRIWFPPLYMICHLWIPVQSVTCTFLLTQVWFIVVIALLVVIILFIILALILMRMGRRMANIRSRMPLQPRQKKAPVPMAYCIDPYDGSIITTVSNLGSYYVSCI